MGKEKLKYQLDLSRRAHLRRVESGLHAQVEALEEWQKRRLLQTYRDLSTRARYVKATGFFIDELYAPADLSQRDEDLERMYPFMVRMLPESVLAVVASALELQALTLELDLNVARILEDAGVAPLTMSAHDYAAAYRSLDNAEVRSHQIDLIVAVGEGLQRYVHNPMIYASLKMARPIAIMTGLQQLQQFLEHGFSAFRSMKDSTHFLTTIETRERRVLQALMADDLAPILAWFGPEGCPQPRPVPG